MQQSAGEYERTDFLQYECELLRTLKFKLRMTSPYDFLVVRVLLPHIERAMSILHSIIDFALSVPELWAVSAEGIFFGALAYSCLKKEEHPRSLDIIRAITHKWDEACLTAQILELNLHRLH
jgi:hypothetical protein